MQILREIEDLAGQLSEETMAKGSNERILKQLEEQLAQIQTSVEEQGRQPEDLMTVSRWGGEHGDLIRQLEGRSQ